jgi:hypothetical protein
MRFCFVKNSKLNTIESHEVIAHAVYLKLLKQAKHITESNVQTD